MSINNTCTSGAHSAPWLAMAQLYRRLATSQTSDHVDLSVLQTGFLLAGRHAVRYGRDEDPKCAEVKLTPISSVKANNMPGGVCWALECGGGYRDESGNSYWRIQEEPGVPPGYC